MVRIIEEFEGRYDFVVIDSPPVLAVTDAAILAVHTDGAVVVLRSRRDGAARCGARGGSTPTARRPDLRCGTQ